MMAYVLMVYVLVVVKPTGDVYVVDYDLTYEDCVKAEEARPGAQCMLEVQ